VDPSYTGTRQILASYHAGFSMVSVFNSVEPIWSSRLRQRNPEVRTGDLRRFRKWSEKAI